MRFTVVRFSSGPCVAGVQLGLTVRAEGDVSLESCDLGVVIVAPVPGKAERAQVLVPWHQVVQADVDPERVRAESIPTIGARQDVEAKVSAELQIDPVGARAMERAGNGGMLGRGKRGKK